MTIFYLYLVGSIDVEARDMDSRDMDCVSHMIHVFLCIWFILSSVEGSLYVCSIIIVMHMCKSKSCVLYIEVGISY